ncbi:hypothetical protein [Streptomyces asiaticus]|uniref:hypothetical protein n=1 Tax=Streptomyces asiaticus TaxID=114695 RepID=UPI001BA538D8|nr:hypothetical protein [Streptomyces asiaticus]
MSAEQIQGIALDTLVEWMDGYYADGERPQLRIRPADVGTDSAVFTVEECDPFPGDARQFRVTVMAEEIAD